MSKSLDQLARNLAGGMSRRKALWQFFTGLGVVGALSGSKSAYAVDHGDSCRDFCDAQAEIFKNLCREASDSCCHGFCAEMSPIRFNGSPALNFNGGAKICFNGTAPGGAYTCVPVYRD